MAPNLDTDKQVAGDALGLDALDRLLHPYYSNVNRDNMACDLVVTYSAYELEATELALVTVPGTGPGTG